MAARAESKRRVENRDISDRFRKYIGRQVSYFTHGIHRYPAKFIPQVPRFCLDKYSRPGDSVIDPFMGSGTTLLEAMLMGRDCYGIDIHPLARLITKVKLTPIDQRELKSAAESLIKSIDSDGDDNRSCIPEIPNFDHWFREEVANELATIKKHIWQLPKGDIRDFLTICFSSVIRRVSNSDDFSLIPEVTTFQKKLVEQEKVDFDAKTRFENTVRQRMIDVQDLNKALAKSRKKYKHEPDVSIIGRDARDIDLEDESIDLGITSPPYASAVHYVSVHKLEMYWLDIMAIDPELDKRIVGTIKAYANEYNNWSPGGILPEIDSLVRKVAESDQKSGYILHRYFVDMRKSFDEMHRVLCSDGAYCVVAGENMLKKTKIPTFKLLRLLAMDVGFKSEAVFDYDIINRHLDVPRWNNSAIQQDHIIVLRK